MPIGQTFLLALASYRPETIVHDCIWSEAAFKQVELRLLFNKLKRRYFHVPHSKLWRHPSNHHRRDSDEIKQP
jgi:hypothetical protein